MNILTAKKRLEFMRWDERAPFKDWFTSVLQQQVKNWYLLEVVRNINWQNHE